VAERAQRAAAKKNKKHANRKTPTN